MAAISCASASQVDVTAVPEAEGRVTRLEPLSWWVGMKTPLQLLVQGEEISTCEVELVGEGVRLREVHKADSPNYLFLDIEIEASAPAGEIYLLFKRGDEQFKVPYTLAERRAGSAERKSFTTSDVIYLLMPDRFANGDPTIDSTPTTAEEADRENLHGRHGGDLQGIIDHLDYIADLGMTAIWSTPLLLDNEPNYSYHGYACADYYHIDPRMGSNELYREYVQEAHQRGLKILMDIVTNHCGMAHWWMKDLPFKDWVHQWDGFVRTNNFFSTNMDSNASKHDLEVQESGWFDTSMPDMNLDNEFVLNYFKQWAVWWIEYADLDGFRVDTYPYNEKEPMSRWCEAVLNEYPHFNIVGECWTANVPQLAYWQGDNPNRDGFNSHLPSIMDFPLRDAIMTALPSDSLRWGEGMTKVYDALSNDFVYHDLSKMMIFTGNHDIDRTADALKGNVDRVKIAMALLATMRGIPQLYSGDELFVRSKDLKQGHGGLRVDTPGGWAEDKENYFEESGRKGDVKEVFDFTRKLFQWRKTMPVLHSGRTLHFGYRDNTYAYFRYNDEEAVLVYVNNSRGRKQLPWEDFREITPTLSEGVDVLTGEKIELSNKTTVPARGLLIVSFKRNK
ncbi:MAG: glycoside hydrolase family 13 protein [Alistipes sp.]|nr:glycoside hydrolase family 13 protein [Alistipes sp.]